MAKTREKGSLLMCAVCFMALVVETQSYVSHIEGTDITYRNLRSVGPRRKQIKEELLTMLGIPSLWRHSSREARNLDASIERKYPERNADPTSNADSLFMLDVYNHLTDSVMGTEMELSILSKPALTIRKIRKTGAGIPSETLLSNLPKMTEELTDESDKIITIQDRNRGPSRNSFESTLNFSVPQTTANDNSELNVATLRIFKRHTDEKLLSHFGNRTFTLQVIELIPSQIGDMPSAEVSKLKLKATDVGWLELDVTNTVNQWKKYPSSNKGLSIKVFDDHGDPYPLQQTGIISAEYEAHLAPFMVLYHKNDNFRLQQDEVVEQRSKRAARRDQKDNDYDYDSADDSVEDAPNEDENRSTQRTSRRKSTRSAPPSKKKGTRKKGRRKPKNKCTKKRGCIKTKKTHCSRDRMYLNFRELGWSQYIIAPEGYAAYRCRGECDLPLNPQLNATNHAIVQALIAKTSMKLNIPKPCCAPIKLEQMTMVYHDEDNRVILRKYKEMVVRSCGCH